MEFMSLGGGFSPTPATDRLPFLLHVARRLLGSGAAASRALALPAVAARVEQLSRRVGEVLEPRRAEVHAAEPSRDHHEHIVGPHELQQAGELLA